MLINQFKPTYYDEFRCTGGECKYTCCQEWDIDLTKSDYYRVRNTKMSKELREVVQGCHKRHKLPESDDKFAYMAKNEAGFCPLLSEEGMCRLQIECGYEVLSSVCKTFPRGYTYTPTGVERTLSIGCEVVVKQLLEQRDGVKFVQDKEGIPHNEKYQHDFFAKKFAEMPIAAYYWDMKALGITILQCQAHTLDDRMMLLGIAMQDLAKLSDEGRLSEIPSYVDRMMADVANISANKIFGDIEIDSDMALDKVWSILVKISDNIPQFVDRVFERLGYTMSDINADNKVTIYHNMDTYRKARERLAKFEQNHPHAMENIMVNEFHRRSIPLDTDFNIWDSYIQFVYEYIFIKLTAAGYLDDSINEDDFIYAVVMIGRRYGHSDAAANSLAELTKLREIATLAHMAIMIKG